MVPRLHPDFCTITNMLMSQDGLGITGALLYRPPFVFAAFKHLSVTLRPLLPASAAQMSVL
eukprot:15458819-Alexandrium_andersonii.AAC.1